MQAALEEFGIDKDAFVFVGDDGVERFCTSSVKMFYDMARTSEKYNLEAIPLQTCHKVGCDCIEFQCIHCLDDPKIGAPLLVKCVGCGKVRCKTCQLVDDSVNQSIAVGLTSIQVGDFVEIASLFRRCTPPDAYVTCRECDRSQCHECLSTRFLEDIVKNSCFNVEAKNCGAPTVHYAKCDDCYYAKKPCTNPFCPNEVGVPTKRCGGCHISRYCSKECQAAAYPEHKVKCERMQAKLAAKTAYTDGE